MGAEGKFALDHDCRLADDHEVLFATGRSRPIAAFYGVSKTRGDSLAPRNLAYWVTLALKNHPNAIERISA